MPPQRNCQTPPIKLSWLTARRCRATFCQVADKYKCQCLKAFCCHLRVHNIPYFKPSHRVFVLGPHSQRYFSTTLQSLLELKYVPRKVKVPTSWLPHHCQFCWETDRIQPPSKYVLKVQREHGRPHWDVTAPEDLKEDSLDKGSSAPMDWA
jgi:hypothetical protein